MKLIGRETLIKLAGAALFAATLGMIPAQSQAQPTDVVELFTSQGCNSCPPADDYLADLARSGNVVALGYHVDYWDYLGWKDTLGSAHNTSRQRAYARSLRDSVYTPEAVVNGRKGVVGSRRGSVRSALDSGGLKVDVSLTRSGNSVTIDTGEANGGAKNADVVLVYFVPKKSVAVQRGENRGKTIAYYNAVTGFKTIGHWNGKAQRFTVANAGVASKGGGCAVLLQTAGSGGPGPIIGAAIMR